MCKREGGGMAGLGGRVDRVDRSPSPLPGIQRALFQVSYRVFNETQPNFLVSREPK